MKKHICPMCGEPLKKGSTACSCGYKESLTDRELLRRLARWDRLRTVCSVMLVLGFVAGGIVWWKSGDIRWGLLALFILLAVGIIGLCRCMPHWRGDLEEIKRILLLAGYDIGVSLGSDGLELADIKRLPEAALNVVLIPELGHEIASYLEMELGQKYLLLTWPYGFNNTLQWLQHIGEAIDWPPQLEELKNEISLAEKDIFDECFLLKHNFLDYSLQRIIMTTPYSIADSLRQAIENSGYDIISAQEYYIKTDESEIIDEKRNYHIWNENISIDKLKADNYQLLLGTERERIGLGDLDRTIYLNFSMPSSKIKSKNIFFAGIRGWQNFMYMFKEQLNTLEYIKYQNQ